MSRHCWFLVKTVRNNRRYPAIVYLPQICCKRAPPYHSGLNIWKKNCNFLDSKNFVKSGLKNSPEQLLARFITETTGSRHNNKDYVCTLFSILKALCACTLPPLTCRCSKVDVSQIHMVNPVNDLKIAHIIACLGIFLWVQNLKLDIWTLETFLNMKKHMNAIICQKFIRKKSVKTLIYLTFCILVTNQLLSWPLWSDLKKIWTQL